MSETETSAGWLTREELRDARERLPIVYVSVVPVRVDERGVVTTIGLLLRASSEGTIDRELVSGRVLYHERIRDALIRHVEKDLGPCRCRGSRCRRSRSRWRSTSRRRA